MKRGRQSKAERAAIAAMSPADLREPWQIEQAARCGCKGTDDMCPCQNENPWPLRNGWRPIGGLPRVFRRLGNETEEGCYDTDWVLCGRWNGKFFTTWVGMLDADEWLGRDDHASCFETDEPEVWQPLPAPPSAHPLPSTASAAANQKPSDVKPPVVGQLSSNPGQLEPSTSPREAGLREARDFLHRWAHLISNGPMCRDLEAMAIKGTAEDLEPLRQALSSGDRP